MSSRFLTSAATVFRTRSKVVGLFSLLVLLVSAMAARAQERASNSDASHDDRSRTGNGTLQAFKPAADAARYSIVKFEVDGRSAALGAIIDTSGLALTKASEVKGDKLTCRLGNGQSVEARVIATDEDDDVALVKIQAACLPAVQWSLAKTVVGQWALTQGIGEVPETIGIVSVPPRHILHERAVIGVMLDVPAAKISRVTPRMGADKAGLKPGDVILAVNESPVKSSEDLTRTLRKFREGQQVTLRVQREEREIEATVQMSSERQMFAGWGFDRQDRMNRLGGALSKRAEDFEMAFQHDSVLKPWQCGGPLLNLEGQAIGLNIARAGRVASYALPASLVAHLIDVLKDRAQIPATRETKATKPGKTEVSLLPQMPATD